MCWSQKERKTEEEMFITKAVLLQAVQDIRSSWFLAGLPVMDGY